jgi:hypothetical protein
MMTSTHGKLVNEGVVSYGGRSVVEIRNLSAHSRLYLAASGTPYPVAFLRAVKNGDGGTVVFGRWNAPITLAAPRGAIDAASVFA